MGTDVLPNSTLQRSVKPRSFDDAFFTGMSLLILVTVFVGFARTYFLAGVFRAPLPNLLIHIHGAVFSSWILLLIAQATLIASGRAEVHRRLGLAGFGLACLMVIVGTLAATNSLARNFAPPGSPFDPLTFYVLPMSDMLLFSTLVFFAFRERFDPAAHKRLILIATIALLDAPTGRPPFDGITHRPFFDVIFVYLFILLILGYDLWTSRSVHRATIWAGAFVFLVDLTRVPIGNTPVWHTFAAWAQTLAHGSHG